MYPLQSNLFQNLRKLFFLFHKHMNPFIYPIKYLPISRFYFRKKKQFFSRNIFLANNFSDIRHHARYCRIQLQYFFPDERSLKSDISSLLVEKWKYLGFSQILPDLISIFFSRRACWWGIYIIDIHTYIYLIIYVILTFPIYFRTTPRTRSPTRHHLHCLVRPLAMDTRYIQ